MKTLILLLTIFWFAQVNGQPIFTSDTVEENYGTGIAFDFENAFRIVYYYEGEPVPEISLYWWDKYCQELNQDSTMYFQNESYCDDYEGVVAEINIAYYYRDGEYYPYKVKYDSVKMFNWGENADSCYTIVYYIKEQPTFKGFINWLKTNK